MELMLKNVLAVPKSKKIEVMMPYMTAMGFKGFRSQNSLYVREELYQIDLDMTVPRMQVTELATGDKKRRFHSYAQIFRELNRLMDKYHV